MLAKSKTPEKIATTNNAIRRLPDRESSEANRIPLPRSMLIDVMNEANTYLLELLRNFMRSVGKLII